MTNLFPNRRKPHTFTGAGVAFTAAAGAGSSSELLSESLDMPANAEALGPNANAGGIAQRWQKGMGRERDKRG